MENSGCLDKNGKPLVDLKSSYRITYPINSTRDNQLVQKQHTYTPSEPLLNKDGGPTPLFLHPCLVSFENWLDDDCSKLPPLLQSAELSPCEMAPSKSLDGDGSRSATSFLFQSSLLLQLPQVQQKLPPLLQEEGSGHCFQVQLSVFLHPVLLLCYQSCTFQTSLISSSWQLPSKTSRLDPSMKKWESELN